MGKINNLSIYKKVTALLTAIMLMFSSLPGIAEDSEVEITNETKTADEFKGNPNELTSVEETNDESTKEEQSSILSIEQVGTLEEFELEGYYKPLKASENLIKGNGNLSEAYSLWFLFNAEHCLLIAEPAADEGLIKRSKIGTLIGLNESDIILYMYLFQDALKNDSTTLRCWFYNEKEYEEFNEYWLLGRDYIREINKNLKKADKNLILKFLEITNEKYNDANASISDKVKICLVNSFMLSEIRSFLRRKKSTKYIDIVSDNLNDFYDGKVELTDSTCTLSDGTVFDINNCKDEVEFLSACYAILTARTINHILDHPNLNEQYNELIKSYKEAKIIEASDKVIEEHEELSNSK